MYPESKIWELTETPRACLCCESTDSLIIDCDRNLVLCTICHKEVSNWLISHILNIYAPDLVDAEVENEIKSYYHIETVEEEEANLNRMIQFFKHK